MNDTNIFNYVIPEAEIQNEELAGTPEARARQMSLFDFFPSGEMPSA